MVFLKNYKPDTPHSTTLRGIPFWKCELYENTSRPPFARVGGLCLNNLCNFL